MKTTKRIFSVTLVLCMLVGTMGVLPMTAFAAGEAKITPSATGGTYDESTNTLTLVGGGEVSFTASGGIEFESVDGTKQPKDGEDTTVDDNVSATLDGTKWVATLPNEDAEYIFRGYYYDTNDDFTLTECTVVVEYGLRAPTNLRWDTSNGTVATWDAVDGATDYIVTLCEKETGSLLSVSHTTPDTFFEFVLRPLSPKIYYFTVSAVAWGIRSNRATSNNITITSDGTPITIGGVSVSVDSIDGTAYIVNRDDIANGSISEVDLSGVADSDSLVIGGKYLAAISTETEITRDEARIIVAEWAEIVNTAEGEEQIKNLLTTYSIYELALLQQYTKILVLDDSTSQKLYELMRVERDRQKELAANTKISFENTAAEMDGDALNSILDQLGDGDALKISVKKAGSEVLPDSLTEKGPYGGIEAAIDKSIFKATGIENIEDRLKTLGLINGNTDSSVTEDEFEYLYHYLTTDELTALKNELNESAHFEHHQNAVNWLAEMIERDKLVASINSDALRESGIWDNLVATGWNSNDVVKVGDLRQANLSMVQLEYAKDELQEAASITNGANDKSVLTWVNEAIAQKELEATCVQMSALLEEARNTQGSYTGLDDVKAAAKDMTTYELKLFLNKANAAKNTESGTLPVLALSAIDSIIEYLKSELEVRDAGDTPTYINTDGTSDGINPLFIGAVDINIGAVKVDGTTTPIAIKADRSDAVAWSTNIDSAWLEQKVAEMKNATGANVALRAYKVLDNGRLEAKAVKVTENADGTLTASVLSNGNSTYVFLLVPEPIEITLNYEDGTTEPTTVQTDENGKLAALPTPTREGYEFVGWFDAKVGGNQITTETVFTEATAIYAQWKEAHTHNFEWKIDKEATETEDGIKHEECACGAKQNENTVIPKTGTTEPDGLSSGAIVAIVIACVVVLAGGGFALYWFVFKKKKV